MTNSHAALLIAILALIVFLSGCATGGTVMLSGTPPASPTPIEKIEIFLEKPDKKYKVIALITASADTDDFLSVSHAEKAALEKLKEQAARAGADGIIDIYREVLEGGSVVSSTVWGSATGTAYGRGGYTTGYAHGTGGGFGALFKSYSIGFRAKAIKFQ